MDVRMILFLLTFLCLYGGINFYFFCRARSFFHFSGFLQVLILILLILLILAPVMVRILESLRQEQLAHLAAVTGYVWMAFVFLFFFLSISLESIRIMHKLIVPGSGTLALKAATFAVSAFLAVGLVVYGYIDAQRIRVKNLQITTDQVLPGSGKLRIVQISDVHVGIIIRNSRLNPLLDRIRESRPDILVSTGDLLDGELDNIMGMRNVSPRSKHLTANLPFWAIMSITRDSTNPSPLLKRQASDCCAMTSHRLVALPFSVRTISPAGTGAIRTKENYLKRLWPKSKTASFCF